MADQVTQFNFVDRSFANPVAWEWDFGDGATSDAQNPSHAYPSGTGVYLARLTASALACGGGLTSGTVWHPVVIRNVQVYSSTIVTGVTYIGGFVWYGFYPYTYTGFDGVNVPDRYLTKTVSGSQSQDQYPDGYILPPMGNITIGQLGGSVEIDHSTGAVVSNTMVGTQTLIGNFCTGLSWRGSYGGSTATISYQVYGSQIEDFLVAGGTVVLEPTVKQYVVSPVPFPTGGGYVCTYCDNGVWGHNNDDPDPSDTGFDPPTEVLSNKMTLAEAAANGGATQVPCTYSSSVSSFNPATGAMNCTASTLTIGYLKPSTTGQFLVTLTYNVQAIGGGPTTTLTKSYAQTVGVGGYLTSFSVDVPMMVGYTVTLASCVVLDILECSDDFEELTSQSWYGNLAAGYPVTANGTYAPVFGSVQPAAECSSDWEDATSSGPILTDPWGYYWAAAGTFSTANYLEASDDFEEWGGSGSGVVVANPVGFWSKGLGWATPFGFFQTITYAVCTDDFESYAVGAITDLNNTSQALNSNQNWSGDGVFGLVVYLTAYDDFESYPAGPIATLPAGGGSWSGAGAIGSA